MVTEKFLSSMVFGGTLGLSIQFAFKKLKITQSASPDIIIDEILAIPNQTLLEN